MGHYTYLRVVGTVRPEMTHVLHHAVRDGWVKTAARFVQYPFLAPHGPRAHLIRVQQLDGVHVVIDGELKDGYREAPWFCEDVLPQMFVEVERAEYSHELEEGTHEADVSQLAPRLPSTLATCSDEDLARARDLDVIVDEGRVPTAAQTVAYVMSSSPALRWAIARAWCRIDRWQLEEDPTESLLAMIADEEPAIRGAAACALCRDDYDAVPDEIRIRISEDPDPLVRAHVPRGAGVARIVGVGRIRPDLARIFVAIADEGWHAAAARFPQFAFLRPPDDGARHIGIGVGDDHVTLTIDGEIPNGLATARWFADDVVPRAFVAIDALAITEDGVAIPRVADLAPTFPTHLSAWSREELALEAAFDALSAQSFSPSPIPHPFRHSSPLVRWAAVRAASRLALDEPAWGPLHALARDPEAVIRGAALFALSSSTSNAVVEAREHDVDPLVRERLASVPPPTAANHPGEVPCVRCFQPRHHAQERCHVCGETGW